MFLKKTVVTKKDVRPPHKARVAAAQTSERAQPSRKRRREDIDESVPIVDCARPSAKRARAIPKLSTRIKKQARPSSRPKKSQTDEKTDKSSRGTPKELAN